MASQKSLVATSQPAFRPDGMEDIDLMRGPMQVLFMDFGAGSSLLSFVAPGLAAAAASYAGQSIGQHTASV